MNAAAQRELRLACLVGAMLALYGGIVMTVAALHGQERLLLQGRLGGMLASIWIAAFAFIFAAYGLDLVLRRRPARPLQILLSELREHMRPDYLIARATVVVGWYVLLLFFTPMKTMIGHIQGFPWDHALAAADQALFFGHDPWRLTHALFDGAAATFVLQFAYNMWFVLMCLSIIYAVMRPEFVALRARYIVAFLGCWMLIGSLAAYGFASAGPCFYEQAFGDQRFAPLMERLHEFDAQIRAVNPRFGVWALDLQDMLWTGFTDKRELFGGGISAMPSMHVAVAVLMALAGRHLGRRPSVLLWIYAAMIWIGSVHLGWHYALDGVVGAAMTVGIWQASGWLVERFVLAEPRRREVLA